MKICSFEGCQKPIEYSKLCSGHRQQKKRGNPLKPLREIQQYSKGTLCEGVDCQDPVYSKKLCRSHYDRIVHAERMKTDPEYVNKKRNFSRLAHQREDPVKKAQQNLEWCRNNKDKRKSSFNKWLAAQRGAVIVERIRREDIWIRDLGICGICQTPADFLNWHLDHVVPLSRGGQHTIDNVQVSHPLCNLRKKDKLPGEFFRERGRSPFHVQV